MPVGRVRGSEPDDPRHVDRNGDRPERRRRAGRDRERDQRRHQHHHDHSHQPGGIYTFTALQPGEYNVEAELSGFKRNVQTGIVLQIAQASRLDIPLEVGAVTEEVRVVSQAPLVRSTSSEQGQVIDYKQIQSLPLNGRLFQQLITLTPGAIPAGFADFAENPAGAGARSAVHHSVNGLPWSGNNYLLDGVANNEPLNAFVNITPPLEALQEFKVQTNNPTAEFGVFGGAVVNLSIRSGTNQFSGSVFEYYRDESLNARNFFAATKAPFNSNQFGGTFGGPLMRNKAFFFGDYQRLSRIRAAPSSPRCRPRPCAAAI